MKKSILQTKIDALRVEKASIKVLATGSGLNSRAHNSTIYKSIVGCGLHPEDEGKTFCVVIGGRCGRYKRDGYYFSIVKF